MSSHQLPDKPAAPFFVQAQGKCDYLVDVIPVETDRGASMVICTAAGAIYVTREQASAFFGLVEPGSTSPGLKDHEIQELVNLLRDKLEPHIAAQSLREMIAGVLVPYLEGKGLRIDGGTG